MRSRKAPSRRKKTSYTRRSLHGNATGPGFNSPRLHSVGREALRLMHRRAFLLQGKELRLRAGSSKTRFRAYDAWTKKKSRDSESLPGVDGRRSVGACHDDHALLRAGTSITSSITQWDVLPFSTKTVTMRPLNASSAKPRTDCLCGGSMATGDDPAFGTGEYAQTPGLPAETQADNARQRLSV